MKTTNEQRYQEASMDIDVDLDTFVDIITVDANDGKIIDTNNNDTENPTHTSEIQLSQVNQFALSISHDIVDISHNDELKPRHQTNESQQLLDIDEKSEELNIDMMSDPESVDEGKLIDKQYIIHVSPTTQISSHSQMRSLHRDSFLSDDEECPSISDLCTPTSDTIRHFFELTSSDSLSGNPRHWEWKQVKSWLKKINLKPMIKIFEDREGKLNGEMLLNINLNSLFTIYDAASYQFRDENDRSITKFFKELTKLLLRSNRKELLSHDITMDDIVEMKRRINLFIEKWDRILWIDYYIETNNKKPTTHIFSQEWGLTKSIARIYLDYYENKDTRKQKDLYDVFQDFDVYSNCILWWYIIISILKTNSSRSLWLILEKVAEITAGNIAIQLLEEFQFDLSRFSHTKLDKVAQNIVCGSQFPICTALRIAKWFNDRALYDVARSDLWKEVAETYIESAIDYLQLVESDHLATVLLEVKSNIDNLSALDMALKYKLQSFCANNRIERITASIMNIYEFLQPENYSDAFEISSLSVNLIWQKMRQKQFYFTPLGMYITTVLLYISYLILFSYLSTHEFCVFGPISNTEKIFWMFNMGYIVHELQNFMLNGLHFYYSQTQNIFDSIICFVFLGSIVIRIYALNTGPESYKYCQGVPNAVQSDCWRDSPINTTFVILYSIATIVLWIGIVNFCVLSQRLGPMITMIFRMMKDITTFFIVMFILFLGFTFGLIFVMGDVHTDFTSPIQSGITLFRAILGDFDFTLFTERNDKDNVNDALILFGYLIMFIYLIIGSLVLLNLLIAMMAKTFEQIQHDNISAIIFSRFELAVTSNNNPVFIPPPLNLLAMVLVIIFYVIEIPIRIVIRIGNLCCNVLRAHDDDQRRIQFDLLLNIMPTWMKKRKMELDEQILFENCNKQWDVTTNEGESKCEILKYKRAVGKHYMKFVTPVSINNSVEKKEKWVLDILELNEQGLMSLEQFKDKIYIDTKWTNKLYDSINKYGYHKSRYWICSYCKKFVMESEVAIKMLGWKLKVRDIEMKIINRNSPIICPSCYRVRLERARIALVWEIFSYWIYRCIVHPILFTFIGLSRLLKRVIHPKQMRHGLIHMRKTFFNVYDSDSSHHHEHEWKKGDELEVQDLSTNEWKKARIVWRKKQTLCIKYYDQKNNTSNTDSTVSMLNLNLNSGDDELDIYQDKERIREILNPEWCNYHYRDWHLIESFKELYDDEHADLFEEDESNKIWRLLHSAKNSIEPSVLKETIDDHVLTLSKEHEIMPSDFHHDYIGMEEIIKECGAELWNNYFQPLSTTIFNRIKNLTEKKVPLHLLARYPFDVSSVLDDMDTYWSAEKPDDVSADEIIDGLSHLQFLNCIDDEERATVVHIIQHKMDFYQTSKDDKYSNQLYHKFLVYLYQIQSLFQETRKLKNMIRDVSKAIIQTDISKSVFLDEIYFLFEDVRNYVESIPFFRSMRTEQFGNETKVELWTIRNTLKVLYFLQHTVKHHIIENNSKIYVTKKEIRAMVFEAFKNDIIDLEKIEEKKNDTADIADIAENKKREKRLYLFQKHQITALDVNKELSSIFSKIQNGRKNRITDSSIAYFRRHLQVKLLSDDESLGFIFEQLSRYCTFNEKEMKNKITANCLYKILSCITFGNEGYQIDEEMKPALVNTKNTKILYQHFLDIFRQTEFEFNYNYKTDSIKRDLTLGAVLSIVTLYYKIFSHLVANQQVANDQFVVTHDHFCKFMDNHFDFSSTKEHWSKKTKASSDLFQSVLDSSKNVVTLGQINQTINKLINDVKRMECGGLIRVMNHLDEKQEESFLRCATKRFDWKNDNDMDDIININNDIIYEITGSNYNLDTKHKFIDPLKYVKDINDWQHFDKITSKTIRFGDTDPGLTFKHIDEQNWLTFITERLDSYRKFIAKTFNEREETKQEQIEFDEQLTEICNQFSNESHGNGIGGILRSSTFGILKDAKSSKKIKKLKRIRNSVFSSALSFNSQRITLQQWYQFSRDFCNFLGKNKKIKTAMKRYLEVWSEEHIDEVNKIKDELKNESFIHTIARKKYFGDEQDEKFKSEINWLFDKTENLYDLCHRMYPFWSAKILKEIYYLLESTEQIQGIYVLKATQFEQLKYSLHVNNNKLANKLFDIIRFKTRTISYNQFYDYFKFLLTTKYKIQKCMIDSRNAQDTTLSKDGLKNALNRSLNDESEWLFDKVQRLYGARITWKQITSYLKNTIRVRDDVRDFFNDKERDKNYKQRGAEVINKISDKQNEIKHELIQIKNDKNIKNSNENNNDMLIKINQIMQQMKTLSQQMENLKQQINKEP